ncbi:MAG TPA: WXG100 family type VII secretion target [Streptosporangiaceae bacterium]|jgi:uncharacterized protein YukE|nr:WXG100 family type VII secretion target [Streptosporangiaceae bacterium]
MPDITADPAKLRQLARTLSQGAQQLDQLARQLQRSLDTTGWMGSERQRFEQDFRAKLKTLSQVSNELKSQQVPDLQKKAEMLERFRT